MAYCAKGRLNRIHSGHPGRDGRWIGRLAMAGQRGARRGSGIGINWQHARRRFYWGTRANLTQGPKAGPRSGFIGFGNNRNRQRRLCTVPDLICYRPVKLTVRIFRSLLQLFFQQFYTTLAWSYDIVAKIVSVGQWNDWGQSILDPYPKDPILEIAHGPGHLLLKLCQHPGKTFGVDASRQMCRMASRRLKRNARMSVVVQARAQALPFQEGSFATILSTFPTEFVLDPASLMEAHRALRLEGQYRIVPMAEIRGPGLLDRMAGWLFRVTGQYAELPASWTQPISDAGFHVRRDDLVLSRARVIRIIATRAKQTEGQVA